MKKLFSILFLSAIFLLPAILPAQAVSCTSSDTYTFEKCSGVNDIAPTIGYLAGSEKTPEYYVGLILTLLFSILGVIFLFLTVYAGIKWMTAQGNTSTVEQAKDTITRSIIGLIICFAAYGLTYFVINIF